MTTMQTGLIVTDGRVIMGDTSEELPAVAVIPRAARIGGETLSSPERVNSIRSLAREAGAKGRVVDVLAAEREAFLATYTAVAAEHRHIVSLHYAGALDTAAREARVCRQLMQPYQQIEVYEIKALESGAAFLLQTAAQLAWDGANVAQVLALLRYLETHMRTLLLTPGRAQSRPWTSITPLQRAIGVAPGSETVWQFDPKQRKLIVVDQGFRLHTRIGLLLRKQTEQLVYHPIVRFRGYKSAQIERLSASLQAAGLPEPRIEAAGATFLPCFPPAFIELLLLPPQADLRRLRALVQDPIWWKGGAA